MSAAHGRCGMLGRQPERAQLRGISGVGSSGPWPGHVRSPSKTLPRLRCSTIHLARRAAGLARPARCSISAVRDVFPAICGATARGFFLVGPRSSAWCRRPKGLPRRGGGTDAPLFAVVHSDQPGDGKRTNSAEEIGGTGNWVAFSLLTRLIVTSRAIESDVSGATRFNWVFTKPLAIRRDRVPCRCST